MSEHILIHEEISEGEFAGGTQRTTVSSIADAIAFYERSLKKPLAYRMAARTKESLKSFDDMRQSIIASSSSNDPLSELTPERLAATRKLFKIPEDTRFLGISLPNLWKVHLYEHKDFHGRKYTLDCGMVDIPYDTSLVDNRFNDIASSIDTGKFVLLTICAEHTWFRGKWWYFFTDDKNFANNGCNDKISSIGATSVSIPSLITTLAALAG